MCIKNISNKKKKDGSIKIVKTYFTKQIKEFYVFYILNSSGFILHKRNRI
jgi:hypothetical protein